MAAARKKRPGVGESCRSAARGKGNETAMGEEREKRGGGACNLKKGKKTGPRQGLERKRGLITIEYPGKRFSKDVPSGRHDLHEEGKENLLIPRETLRKSLTSRNTAIVQKSWKERRTFPEEIRYSLRRALVILSCFETIRGDPGKTFGICFPGESSKSPGETNRHHRGRSSFPSRTSWETFTWEGEEKRRFRHVLPEGGISQGEDEG